jgi:hypothetical protein
MKNLLRKIRDAYRRWYVKRHGWTRAPLELERWTDPKSTRVIHRVTLSKAYRIQQARNMPYAHIVRGKSGYCIYRPEYPFAVGSYPTRENARRVATINGWRVR